MLQIFRKHRNTVRKAKGLICLIGSIMILLVSLMNKTREEKTEFALVTCLWIDTLSGTRGGKKVQ